MTKGMQERTFGLDVNPVGFTTDEVKQYMGIGDVEPYTIYNELQDTVPAYGKIIDVVDTGDWMLTENQLLVVTDLFQEFENSKRDRPWHNYEKRFSFILAKGKTANDLLKELHEAFPEYKVTIEESKGLRTDILTITGLMIIISSILLIGMFGFLKMQIQLFRLRQREIGLRQCMGARWGQLFGMLIWEVAIIFFFVTPLTLLFTYLLADSFEPVLYYMNKDGFVAIDLQRIYATELGLCVGVFVVTSLIAAFSVRKVVVRPLSEVVGKSQRKLTRSYNLLIVLQMVICLILFSLPMSLIYKYRNNSPSDKRARTEKFMKDYNMEEGFKEGWEYCMITDNDQWSSRFLDTLQNLQHVEGVTHFASTHYSRYLKEGDEADNVKWDENGQRYIKCEVVLTDRHLFDLLDLELVRSATDKQCKSEGLVPVYQGMPNGDKLKKLGYVKLKPLTIFTWESESLPEAIYVCDTAFFLQHRDLTLRVWEELGDAFKNWGVKHNIIFKAKPDEYEDAVKELADLYPNLGSYTTVDVPVDNLAEKCYHMLYMISLIFSIVVVIFFVSLARQMVPV